MDFTILCTETQENVTVWIIHQMSSTLKVWGTQFIETPLVKNYSFVFTFVFRLDPTARKRMNKKQIEVFQKFLEDRRKKAEASGEEFQIFTKDFIALKPRLNEFGPPFRSVNQWKLVSL